MKDGASPRRRPSPPIAAVNPIIKIFLCFETKSFLATLFGLTLVVVFWNLQPDILFTSLCSSTTTSAAAAATSLPIKYAAIPSGITPLSEKKQCRVSYV